MERRAPEGLYGAKANRGFIRRGSGHTFTHSTIKVASGCGQNQKDSLAVHPSFPQLYCSMFTPKRMSRPALSLSCLLLVLGSGCFHSKKNATPKENPAIASETEADFKQRFMEKRMAELVAQGVAPDAARVRANEEFRSKYSATTAAQK